MWKALLKRATVEQWQAIDAEYRQEPLPSQQAAWILVVAALCLILPRYFGSESAVRGSAWLSQLTADWPYPRVHGNVYWALFKLLNYGLLPYLYASCSSARCATSAYAWSRAEARSSRTPACCS